MPAQTEPANVITFVPGVPIPSLHLYLKCSLFLFCCGFYYFYKVCESLFFSNEFSTISDDLVDSIRGQSGDTLQTTTINESSISFSDKALYYLMSKHKLCFYILLNTFCALISLLGKLLVFLLFDTLSSQEETLMQKSFRRFVHLKLTFLVFISHHNLLEDILIWFPWLAIQAVFMLLLDLAASRMRNSFSAVSNKRVRNRLYITNLITSFGSLLMVMFVLRIRDFLTLNYTLFLIADCSLLLIQSIQQFFKLIVLLDENSPRLHSSSLSYYVDLWHDIFHDSIEFINYLHMIFFSQLAVTYCCIFLMIQARHYYYRISTKLSKHLQHQKILQHISNCYAEATDEDLRKNTTCAICWETMRSARKLPCSHIFHELCLRRWLEQDSSCAICRQALSLNLNHVLREENGAVEDVDPTLQYLMEAVHTQNSGFGFVRWWTRLLFFTLDNDQINAMVNQVAEMFPQTPRATIVQVIQQTGSVNLAVEVLLESRQNTQNAVATQNNEINQAFNLDDTSGSDSASDSGSDNVDESSSNVNEFDNPLNAFKHNTWISTKLGEMIEVNRRKYLNSSRASDLRHLSF